ncbi:beta strand repeat-containing protein, partial [Chitinimonas sp. BJB300]|uniref:beta strand repeat-containing protein n=1 Tax=Chitinimonas sp. BJB300 TaxID=1559339 RepID=UPI000C0E9BF4
TTLSLTAGDVDNQAAGQIRAGSQLNLTAQQLQNQLGQLSAGKTLHARLTTELHNEGGQIAAQERVALQAADINNHQGVIQSTGALDLIASGTLHNGEGQLQSGQTLDVKAGVLRNAGTIYSQGVGTFKLVQLDNAGTMASRTDLQINADETLTSQAGSVLAAGLNTDGALSNLGNLTLTAGQTIAVHSKALAGNQFTARIGEGGVNAGRIDLNDSTVSAAHISLQAGEIDTQKAAVTSTGTLKLNANQLYNQLGTLQGGGFDVQIRQLHNQGGKLVQTGAVASTLTLQSLNNDAGLIASNGVDFSLQANALSNVAGQLQHAGTGTFNLKANDLNSARGQIASNGLLAFTGGKVSVDQGQVHAKQIKLHAASLSNVDGKVIQSGSGATDITVAGALDNSRGQLTSNGDFHLAAGSVSNLHGKITAAADKSLAVKVAGLLDNSRAGEIRAGGNSTISAHQLANQTGAISALNELTMSVTGGANNDQGMVESNGNLNLAAAEWLNGQGTIRSHQANLTMTTSGALLNAGQLQGQSLSLTAGSVEHAGTIYAAGNADIAVAGRLSASGTTAAGHNLTLKMADLSATSSAVFAAGMARNGQLSAQGNLSVQAQNTVVLPAQLMAGQNLLLNSNSLDLQTLRASATSIDLTARAGAIDTRRAQLVASQDIKLTATTHFDNRDGKLQAGGNVWAQAQGMDNSRGLIQAGKKLHLDALTGMLTNRNSGTDHGVVAFGDITLKAGAGIANEAGYIGAGKTLTAATGGAIDNTRGGQLVSVGNVSLQAVSLDNRGGTVDAAHTTQITTSGMLNNSAGGLLRGSHTLSLTAANMNNQAGKVDAGDLVVKIGGALRNDQGGYLRANHHVTINAAQVNNQSGEISAKNQLRITTPDLINTDGQLLADGALKLDAARFTADGKIKSHGAVELAFAGDYVNQGVVAADGSVTYRVAGKVSNAGTISAQDGLNIFASNLKNESAGKIFANTLSLDISERLENIGLINGNTVSLKARELSNSGRIYGDTIAILPGTGSVDNHSGGVIASRGDLSVTMQQLQNRTGAEIVSLGNATFKGDVKNLATRIDIGGNLSMQGKLENISEGVSHKETVTDEAIFEVDFSRNGRWEVNTGQFHYEQHGGKDIVFRRVSSTFYDRSDVSAVRNYTRTITKSEVTVDRLACINVGGAFNNQNAHIVNDNGTIIVGGRITGGLSAIENKSAPSFTEIKEVGTEGLRGKWVEPWQAAIPYRPAPIRKETAATLGIIKEHATVNVDKPIDPSQPVSVGAVASNANLHGTAVKSTAAGGGQAAGSAVAGVGGLVAPGQASGAQVAAVNGVAGPTAVKPTVSSTTLTSADSALSSSAVASVTGKMADAAVGGIASDIVLTGAPSGNTTVPSTAVAGVTGQTADITLETTPVPNSAGSEPAPTLSARALLDQLRAGERDVQAKHWQQVNQSELAAPKPLSATGAVPVVGTTVATNAVAPATPTHTVATPVAPGSPPVVVRTLTPNPRLPTSKLFVVDGGATSRYVVETDPTFTNYKTWLSSDYLLDRLKFDPATIQKRLGDGFYEQRLIREQINQLTGR